MRLNAPVLEVLLKHNFLVEFRAHKSEGTGADRLAGEFAATAVGHDADGAFGQVPKQSCEWLFEVKNDGQIVTCLDVVDESVGVRFAARNLTLQERIEGPFHIARG